MEEETTTTKIITTYEADGSSLKETRTPSEIIPEVTTYDIEEIQKEIDKIDLAITKLENKKAPLQAIIDKYNEIRK